jgi:cytolysin-activating lysine-acyltransferase
MYSNNLCELGKLSWLWINSPLHNAWSMESFFKYCAPPLALNQYILIERNGMPIAYCSWAFLNSDTESKYMLDCWSLNLDDWCSGDRLWFIDWVAPFDKLDSLALRRLLMEKFKNNVARAVRVRLNNKNARVMEFKGRNMAAEKGSCVLMAYHQEFREYLTLNK